MLIYSLSACARNVKLIPFCYPVRSFALIERVRAKHFGIVKNAVFSVYDKTGKQLRFYLPKEVQAPFKRAENSFCILRRLGRSIVFVRIEYIQTTV